MFTDRQPTGGGRPPPVSLFRRWMKLLLVFILIAVSVRLAHNLERLPLIGSAISDLRKSDIDVGAWYYDDVKEYFEAEKYVREKLHPNYPKRRKIRSGRKRITSE